MYWTLCYNYTGNPEILSYGTQTFIAIFTKGHYFTPIRRHFSLFRILPAYFSKIALLSTPKFFTLPLTWCFPTKILYAFFASSLRSLCPTHLILLVLISLTVWQIVQIFMLLAGGYTFLHSLIFLRFIYFFLVFIFHVELQIHMISCKVTQNFTGPDRNFQQSLLCWILNRAIVVMYTVKFCKYKLGNAYGTEFKSADT